MATKNEVIAAIRSENVGSQQLNNMISDLLGVSRNQDFTHNFDTIFAHLFQRFPGMVCEVSRGKVKRDGFQAVEFISTIGTPPGFVDHVHGFHPSNPHLSIVNGILEKLVI